MLDAQNFRVRMVVPCDGGFFVHVQTRTCRQCPAGTSSPHAQFDLSSCGECAAGTFSSVGSAFCKPCSTGSYSKAGSGLCTASCPAGTFTSGSSCYECPAGSFSTTGSLSCSACSSGRYSTENSAICLVCASGSISSPNSSSCQACEGGFVAAHDNSSCVPIASATKASSKGDVELKTAASISGLASALPVEELLQLPKGSNIDIIFYVSASVGGGMIFVAITGLVYRNRRSRRVIIGAVKEAPSMAFNFATPVPNGSPQSLRKPQLGIASQSSSMLMLNPVSGFQLNSPFGSQAMLPSARLGRPLQIYGMPTRAAHTSASSIHNSGTQSTFGTSVTGHAQKYGKTETLAQSVSMRF